MHALTDSWSVRSGKVDGDRGSQVSLNDPNPEVYCAISFVHIIRGIQKTNTDNYRIDQWLQLYIQLRTHAN